MAAMKVYEFILEPRDQFVLYLTDDGKATLNTDPINPIPSTSPIWDKNTKSFISQGPPYYDRFFVSPMRFHIEDVDEYLKENMINLIEASLVYDIENANLLILRKDLHDGTCEIGYCVHKGYSDIHNEELQKMCDSINKLKAFW